MSNLRFPPGLFPPGTVARLPQRVRSASPQSAPPPLALPPVAVFDAPQAPAPAAPPPPQQTDSGIASGYETFTKEYFCSDLPIVAAAGNAPMTVYQTKARWKALDVYALTDFAPVGNPSQAFISFGIYAISRGLRSLVATGRIRGGSLGLPGQRVASARVVCDRFEVVMQRTNITMAAPTTMKVSVSIVASDSGDSESIEDLAGLGAGQPGDAGIIPVDVSGAPTLLTLATPKAITVVQGQLPLVPVALHAVNTAGAVRYIQLSSSGGTTLASFSIPAGESLIITDPRLLRRYLSLQFATNTISFRQSSTPIVNTPSADVNFAAWVR